MSNREAAGLQPKRSVTIFAKQEKFLQRLVPNVSVAGVVGVVASV